MLVYKFGPDEVWLNGDKKNLTIFKNIFGVDVDCGY